MTQNPVLGEAGSAFVAHVPARCTKICSVSVHDTSSAHFRARIYALPITETFAFAQGDLVYP